MTATEAHELLTRRADFLVHEGLMCREEMEIDLIRLVKAWGLKRLNMPPFCIVEIAIRRNPK